MKLKELYIENFGKLTAYRKSFSPGLNEFCLDNGAGKTTLTYFIKAMLYGLDASRKQTLAENDRKKYTPWQGGGFGGWLTLETGGKEYRIERTFGQKASDDTFTLYDLATGRISDDFTENLGSELFGIDADGFERTVFLSERNITGKNENQTISAKLSDLVGVEGDIGGFDAAIALLDNRRKFYQKRGGAGEIQDLRNAISETEDEIHALDEKAKRLIASEAELAELKGKAVTVRAKKEALLAKRREDARRREVNGLIAQYSAMLSSLSEDEAKEARLLAFFEKKIPTNSEIREVAELIRRADALDAEASPTESDKEYAELSNFFANEVSAEECTEMVRIAEELTEVSATPEIEVQEPRCPFARIPTEDEISDFSERVASKKGAGRSRFVGGILLAAGISAIAVGAVFYASAPLAFYVILALAAALLAGGTISLISGGKASQREAESFIRSVLGEVKENASPLSTLIEMRANLERYRAEVDQYKLIVQEKAGNAERTRNMQLKLNEFLGKFDTPPLSALEKARFIAAKHQRLVFLGEQTSQSADAKRRAIAEARELRARAGDFLALFPTKTDKPLDELRAALAEYEVLTASLTARRRDAERFALQYGINATLIAESSPVTAPTDSEADIALIDDELLSLERSLSDCNATVNALTRELEMRPVLEERLNEFRERYELYEANLRAIKKAKELLERAKTNMTARYLDGTSRGFKKYVSLIDGDEADFSMDTSFTVTRSDHGASRATESYSRGTRDLFALAVRLSLSDALYDGDLPPVILDDPFTAFDDTHTERAVTMLKKMASDRQILYFTCSKSRKVK